MKYSLIQFDDIKAKKLSEGMKDSKYSLKTMSASPILTPLVLTKNIMTKGRPETLIYRYLNDYPSLFKTILRILAEIFSILICAVLKVDLIWICHNVDKESKEYHPFLTNLRRKLIVRFSKKVLVTDKLLIKEAQKHLNIKPSKIDYITFGSYLPSNTKRDQEATEKIKDFINCAKKNTQEKYLIGLCISSANKKNISYEEAINLLDKSSFYEIFLIFVGEISEEMKERNKKAYEILKEHSKVLIINEKIHINEKELSDYIDFYWRVYDDQSVPFTAYNAATIKKPILTKEIGFLGEMTSKYKIGIVLNENNTIDEQLTKLKNWDKKNAIDFLENNNWEVAVNRLKKHLKFYNN
ncbi:hypothetical protein [Marinococcus sp. PL1-022]|uniref:hypothetical protein n=1 Tax=Marinococcus sp. PL1-022 TaxID=3095363 RepID=UPI0029C4843A|nr:hypothetical protein [Marinococcus sp. PL1-022]MDX6153990.1 hypothetical protein [Marinococcus sp. PL1-022]